MMKRRFLQLLISLTHLIPAGSLLRFLFRLDSWLYYLQGQVAIRYGVGVHPKHRLIRYHDFFVNRIKPGDQILDIGCGNGAVAHDLAERAGAVVTGIDINPKNIAMAKAKNAHPNIEYQCGDVTESMPAGAFDVILFSNVLEHLQDRSKLLAELQSAIRPDRFLIRVPLFERDWRVPLKRELGVEWRLDPTHEIEYTLETFAEEIERAGLRIRYQEIRWGEIWAEVGE